MPISMVGIPFASRKWWISEETVDLPFVPVTPTTRQGFILRSSSVCDSILAFAALLSLFLTATPGDCRIMSYSAHSSR